jgi:hypothetical protein
MPILQSRALSDDSFVHFFARLQHNDRFTVRFFDAGGVFVSVDEPQGSVWHGTFLEVDSSEGQ